MTSNQYFRAGVGAVIYNDKKEIFIFKRSTPPNIWQLPQGGIDADETPEDALWRELKEETYLNKDDIESVSKYPNWLYYEYNEAIRRSLHHPNSRGQIHQWYFLKIKSKRLPDLSKASDKEFSDVVIADFSKLINQDDELKKSIYQQLKSHFELHI